MFEQTLTSDALVTTTHNHAAEPTQRPLRDSVQQALRNYLAQLNGQEVIDLYDMVL
ncbi:MAG: Fis family transcriptional regulator, partial [Aeromonas jandaei]